MIFRIADTFVDSLAKLDRNDQQAVKSAAFDLQLDPTDADQRLHRLEEAADPFFFTSRVHDFLRLIVYRRDADLLLLLVDGHEAARNWAKNRKIATHPVTGAAQLRVIRSTVEERSLYTSTPEPAVKPYLPLPFDGVPEMDLLAIGVPDDWIADVRAANQENILQLAPYLPGEATEGLLDLAAGVPPEKTATVDHPGDPFDHPDARRRFVTMNDAAALERALAFPWDKWTVFLHPAQQRLVERKYRGPARIAGSAGTGKTVVALHRAVHLARTHPDSRVLLTTFSDTLAADLEIRLQRLAGNEPKIIRRLAVHAIDAIAERLHADRHGPPALVADETVRGLLDEAAIALDDHRFNRRFLWREWNDVVDFWQVRDWQTYRRTPRPGRKSPLDGQRRALLWPIFQRVRHRLEERGLCTRADLLHRLTAGLAGENRPLFDFIIADESQDLGVPALRFLAALAGPREEALFFTGDLGQRIFQQPFSWRALGIDIRGRSRVLRLNYRTSRQIRRRADRLLPAAVSDVDGQRESRLGVQSIFDGPEPEIHSFPDMSAECAAVADWLSHRLREGFPAAEMALFVRSSTETGRAQAVIRTIGGSARDLAILTMPAAKGLEFRAVVVMACDEAVLPPAARIETAADEADLDEILDSERHLLYVACTRARDHLLITGVEPVSELLADFAT